MLYYLEGAVHDTNGRPAESSAADFFFFFLNRIYLIIQI